MNRSEWLERLVTGGEKKHTGGIVYNKEQVNTIMGFPSGRITAITYYDDKTGTEVEFFTNNHIYGYPDLGDNFVSCSMVFPNTVTPRPGCEDGIIDTHDKYRAVHKTHRTLWTVEEVIDFLAELGRVDGEEHCQ